MRENDEEKMKGKRLTSSSSLSGRVGMCLLGGTVTHVSHMEGQENCVCEHTSHIKQKSIAT